jgi:hypothetical protein
MADLVEIILALRGVAAFVADADKAAASMDRVGGASKKAGAAGITGGKALKYGMLAAGAGIYGAVKLADSATHAVTNLAGSTLQLQRLTGLDTQTASEWVSLMEERGVSAQQAGVGIVKLSKEMLTARTSTKQSAAEIAGYRQQIDQLAAEGGPKSASAIAGLTTKIETAQKSSAKARTTFAAMGISLDDLRKGNTEQVLLKVSSALQQNHDAASRATAIQTLFGRSGRALLPILMQGATGVHKLLDEQKASGNYLSGRGMQATHNLILEQRELNRQWAGFKVQLGQSLLPVLSLFLKALQKIMQVLQPLSRHGVALTLVLIGLTSALVAAKIATIAQAVAAEENTVATQLWTAAQWLLNASLYGFPVIWIVAAIALIVVAVYELVKHWTEVSAYLDFLWHGIVDGASWALKWLRANWPYVLGILLGPLGLAAVAIYKHWASIKTFILGIVHDIEHALERLVGFAKSIPSKIGHGVLGLLSHIPGAGLAKSVLGAFAAGGTAATSGPYLVGEQGPEIVHLPRGGVVAPISLPQLAAATGQGSSPLQLTIPLIVDGRELARAVATVTSNQLARK